MDYTPQDWFWIVGSDESKAWSSANLEYVTHWPDDRVSRTGSEAELSETLQVYGIYGPSLDAIRRGLQARVDADAEAVRLRYITAGSGMAMVYQEKFAQAQAVNAMGETAANAMSQADREAQFPTLAASVGLEAPTLWGCAQLVLAKYAAFAALSLTIEKARLTAKAQIAAASNVQGVRSAYEAIAWPTP